MVDIEHSFSFRKVLNKPVSLKALLPRLSWFFLFFPKKNMTELKTTGEICDRIAKAVTKFYVEILKSGPRESKCYLVEDMVIVRLRGNLLPIEQQILNLMHNEKGIELIKNIRKTLHQITTKRLYRIIEEITQCKVISSHSDISTKTGERVEIFVLNSNLEKKLKEKEAVESAAA